MVSAVWRLVLITFIAVIVTVFSLMAIHLFGLSQQFAPPPHPWFQQKFWWIYAPDTPTFCRHLDAKPPGPQWITTLPLKWVEDQNQWQVACPTPVPLDRFFSKAPAKDWLIRPLAKGTLHMDILTDELDKWNDKGERFGLLTPSQNVNLYLRHHEPEWLFAADGTLLLRLRLFETLWIDTAMNFEADFVIVSMSPKSPLHIDRNEAKELHRRKKRLIWDWENNERNRQPEFPIDGVMTNRPSEAEANFTPGLAKSPHSP